ncbi:MAG: alkylmercury lyase MerB [Nevskiales bacterium]
MARILSLFPKLDNAAQRLSLALYRQLARGEPVSTTRLAAAVDRDASAVSEQLSQWPGVFYDEQGAVIGYWGLSIHPMAHRFRVNGRNLYTWCAWDSLFIPELLGETAHVESFCPVTRTPIRLTVTPQGVEDLQPATAVMSLMLPAHSSVMSDIAARFCHYVHFFESANAATRWLPENPSTMVVGVGEGFELGRMKNDIQYLDQALA